MTIKNNNTSFTAEEGKEYIDYLTDDEEIDYVNSLLDELK